MVCVCVFVAGRLNGGDRDHRNLQAAFNVPNRKMLQGLKKLCFVTDVRMDTHHPRNLTVSAEEIVRTLLRRICGTTGSAGDICRILSRVCGHSSILSRCRPQSLAASAVCYWLQDNGFEVPADIQTHVGLSASTIRRITNEIAAVLRRLEAPCATGALEKGDIE